MDNFLINTDYNNQKILLNTSQTLNVGSPSFVGTYNYNHQLGYIPVVRVWYEPLPGQWYPLTTRQMQNASPLSYLELTGTFWVDTTSLEVEIRNFGVAATCNIWVRVYFDD